MTHPPSSATPAAHDANPMPRCDFTVRLVSWADHAAALSAVREAVFVVEQAVPAELEWDGIDADCLHAMACSAAGEVIGTGRLLPDGHIGRMAVLAAWRGNGVGAALLGLLLAEALRLGHLCIQLNAQVAALGFYARAGFEAQGEVFLEADIPHRVMVYRGVQHECDRADQGVLVAATGSTSTRQS